MVRYMGQVFCVRQISEEDDGTLCLVLEKKREFKGKKSRKERWESSDKWYPADDDCSQYSMFRRPNRMVLAMPMSRSEFNTSGITLGSEVRIILQPIGKLIQ